MTATTRDAVNQAVSTPWVSAVLTSPQARSFGTYVFSFFTLFLLWHIMATYIFPSVLFSPPLAVFKKAVELTASGVLLTDIAVSMKRILLGFAIGSALGFPIGLLMGNVRFFRRLFEPYTEFFRFIPAIALLTLAVIWFGIGEASKVAFITYAAFFPIFTTTIEGIKYVDPILIRAASSLGASERQIFWHVVLPAATPNIITGMRLAFGLSFFVIVAAEFIAADSGLGFLINDARTFFLVSNMLLGAAVIGIIGVLANVLLRKLEGRLLRWRKESRGQA